MQTQFIFGIILIVIMLGISGWSGYSLYKAIKSLRYCLSQKAFCKQQMKTYLNEQLQEGVNIWRDAARRWNEPISGWQNVILMNSLTIFLNIVGIVLTYFYVL